MAQIGGGDAVSGDMAEIFSRKMRAGSITGTPVQRRIDANAAECTALGEVFGLPAIAGLSGDFTLVRLPEHGRNGVIDARLALRARVTQTCVVSLEPFESEITEAAKLRFIPAAAMREDAEIAVLDPETLDGPDEVPYGGDSIDLGAALAEQLALALDPYPRKPGAAMPAGLTDDAAHPFAALAARKLPPANDAE